jgi:hypothetical protein
LVALDCAVDTTTPAGEAMAHVLATFAQFERRLISQRTREALAVKKAQGVRLGRPREMPAKLRKRIRAMHERGDSLAAIARTLNAEGVPTAHGGARWHPSTIRAVLERAWIANTASFGLPGCWGTRGPAHRRIGPAVVDRLGGSSLALGQRSPLSLKRWCRQAAAYLATVTRAASSGWFQ